MTTDDETAPHLILVERWLDNVVRISPDHPSVASKPDRRPYDQDNDGSDGEPRPIIRTYEDVGDPFLRYLTVEGSHIGEHPSSPKVVRVTTHYPPKAGGQQMSTITDLSPAMATQFALAVLAAATKAGE